MEWIKIFPSKEEARKRIVGNKPQLVIVHGIRICVVLLNDSFFAVEDKCSHNGESLSKGTINYLGEVICPWHGYRFNLHSGKEAAARSRDLNTYPIKEDESGFFIGV